MKHCEQCTTVQPRGDGIWKCMCCNRPFIPLYTTKADVQKPVSPLESMLREDYSTQGQVNESESKT